MKKHKILYGTAGWSYKDWVGPFYPEKTPDNQFLSYYSQKFPAVEIDSTFYRTPSTHMTAAWDRNTPDDFVFSPKMVRDVTHDNFLLDCEDLVKGFLDGLAPMAVKVGLIVLQFPYYRKDTGVNLDAFLERLLPFLDSLPPIPRFGVEVRNKPFLKPALLEALKERNVPLVLIDHIWMPKPLDLLKIDGIFTSDIVPIRLLGDRYGIEKITKTWDKIVVDQTKKLEGWAEVIQRALEKRVQVQAFANNHYAGFGPATITQLVDILEKGKKK